MSGKWAFKLLVAGGIATKREWGSCPGKCYISKPFGMPAEWGCQQVLALEPEVPNERDGQVISSVQPSGCPLREVVCWCYHSELVVVLVGAVTKSRLLRSLGRAGHQSEWQELWSWR